MYNEKNICYVALQYLNLKKKTMTTCILLGNEITRISEKRKITLLKILIQDDTIVCCCAVCNQEQYQALMTWNAGKCG